MSDKDTIRRKILEMGEEGGTYAEPAPVPAPKRSNTLIPSLAVALGIMCGLGYWQGLPLYQWSRSQMGWGPTEAEYTACLTSNPRGYCLDNYTVAGSCIHLTDKPPIIRGDTAEFVVFNGTEVCKPSVIVFEEMVASKTFQATNRIEPGNAETVKAKAVSDTSSNQPKYSFRVVLVPTPR